MSAFLARLALVLVASFTGAACAARGTAVGRASDEWPAYGRDAFGSRFSPLTDIDRSNVNRLSVAWTYHTGEPLPTAQRRRSLEVTPIVLGGVIRQDASPGDLDTPFDAATLAAASPIGNN